MKVIIKVSLLYYVFNMIGYDTFVTVIYVHLACLFDWYSIWLPNGFRSKQRCPLNYHKMEGSSDSQYLSPSYFVEIYS